MRITVDQGRCVGAGQCVMAAAEVFDQRDVDGIVELLNASPPTRLAEDVWEAAEACPARAIVVDES
ncbi:ferredoxin [Mycobacteroides abscessus]|uniref:ferredoxin n=1 Tax=Mycobacteroides abscessus TaxID=36809 RepID=UPI0021060A4A|nr:ferredoxin [Mycobacteroides abscessus]